ncbi:alpha-amylase family glycosyl hydrolase [Hymenobacter algoricola]
MKTLRLLLCLLALLTGLPAVQAQVVTTQPSFFRDTDAVTLTFDATKGNGGLLNFTGDVYVYTGVITNLSTSNTDWKYVKNPAFNQGDPASKLTRTGPNTYTITLTPRTFYNVPAGQTILKLAMLFKSADGTVVGRGDNGNDILIDVFQGGLAARITSPVVAGGSVLFVPQNTAVSVSGEASAASNLTLALNKVPVAQQANATTLTGSVTVTQPGRNVVRFTATAGATTVSDSVILTVRPTVNVAPLPAGAKDGITYLPGGTSVILNLTAPAKQFVYVLGEFNNWQIDNAAFMNQTPDGTRWWIQINNLEPGREYGYQYLVDGSLRIGDPYSDKVLDPSNDRFITAVTYPNLKPYPTGLTTGIVSVLQTNQTAYQWTTTGYQRPKRTDLVLYELHLRDFIQRHDFQTLRDTLTYLQKLGINAVELMPVNEFEGNDSWGYNPSYYFAPDKYYGPKDDLKRFIDECHRRGMAVVLDMVLNHSCGQSPMVQLYFDGGNPAPNSPWFNRTATHPFNVCYDFNHESAYTKYFSKKVMSYWLEEYKVDGYRFDLSKGFTQKVSALPNLTFDQQSGLMAQYDQSRIDIWKDYYNHLVSVDPNVYAILEHFADNSEEKVLADYGMMLWGNMHGNYSQAAKGLLAGSDLSGGAYSSRQFQQPNLVTYMESHDEERLMVTTLTGGSSSGTYNTRDLNTALARQEMLAAFFFTIPGPKMVWQFGELGYDVSINSNGRTGAKPIRWNYYGDANRRRLHDVYAKLIALKVNEPALESRNFSIRTRGTTKAININDPSMDLTIVGNFSVNPDNIFPNFQRAGKWYNYLTGDSITVTDPAAALNLQPGEYAVYTSRKVKTVTAMRPRAASTLNLQVAPNPTANSALVRYELTTASPVTFTVLNLLGATVRTVPVSGRQTAGSHELRLPTADFANGVYLLRLTTGEQQQTLRLVVQH